MTHTSAMPLIYEMFFNSLHWSKLFIAVHCVVIKQKHCRWIYCSYNI